MTSAFEYVAEIERLRAENARLREAVAVRDTAIATFDAHSEQQRKDLFQLRWADGLDPAYVAAALRAMEASAAYSEAQTGADVMPLLKESMDAGEAFLALYRARALVEPQR